MEDLAERQQAELDALKAMYPEEGAVMLDNAMPRYPASLEAGEGVDVPSASASSTLSGTALLLKTKLKGRPVGIHFQLPAAYPEQAPAVQVICETGDTWRIGHDLR